MTDSPERMTDRELMIAEEFFAQKEYRSIVRFMVTGLLLLILGTVQFIATSDFVSIAVILMGTGIIGMNLFYWFTVKKKLKAYRHAAEKL